MLRNVQAVSVRITSCSLELGLERLPTYMSSSMPTRRGISIHSTEHATEGIANNHPKNSSTARLQYHTNVAPIRLERLFLTRLDI